VPQTVSKGSNNSNKMGLQLYEWWRLSVYGSVATTQMIERLCSRSESLKHDRYTIGCSTGFVVKISL